MYHTDLLRHPDSCPALVLNADYTPLSYYPLSLWPWQTAIKAMFLERVDVVAHYDREVHSPSASMKLPSVIALRQFVRPNEIRRSLGSTFSSADRFPLCLLRQSPGIDLTMSFRARRADDHWENAPPLARRATQEGRRTPREAKMHIEREPIRRPAGSCRTMARASHPIICTKLARLLYWDVELEHN